MRTLRKPWRGSMAPSSGRQSGVLIIEFALVAIVFLAIVIGIMEFGRWLFTLGAAVEATRWGARLAVVCGSPEDKIQSHVDLMLHTGGTLRIAMSSDAAAVLPYPSPTCITSDCVTTVWLEGAKFEPLIPFLGGSWDIPKFTTTLPRESLGVLQEGSPPVTPTNDICPT